MYIERWLNAPIIKKDGTQASRDKGTPHNKQKVESRKQKVFDKWLLQTFKWIKFERYADDIIIHCQNLKQAEEVLEKVKLRLQTFKLELHPDKTKIVYCKQANRKEKYGVNSFIFLGVQFRPLKVKDKQGVFFKGFTSVVPKSSSRKIGDYIKRLSLHRQTDRDIYQLAEMINGRLTGWFNYFKKWGIYKACGYFFYKLNQRLTKWAMNRHKRLYNKRKAIGFLKEIQRLNPYLFVHWKYGFPV